MSETWVPLVLPLRDLGEPLAPPPPHLIGSSFPATCFTTTCPDARHATGRLPAAQGKEIPVASGAKHRSA